MLLRISAVDQEEDPSIDLNRICSVEAFRDIHIEVLGPTKVHILNYKKSRSILKWNTV